MKNLLTWLSKRRHPYEPLITVEISKKRLLHNLQQFQKLAAPAKVAPVLKSNAYGHGLFEIAHILEDSMPVQGPTSIPFFAVDSYFEAIALRARGVRTPLLIIGYTRPETMLNSNLRDTSFTITDLETLKDVRETRHAIRIHLKIDTGMHRQGVLPKEVDEASRLIKNSQSFILEGIASHLSDADNPDKAFARKQISIWNEIAKKFKAGFSTIKYVHLSATDGHRFTNEIEGNVTRLGIGLYGLADGSAFAGNLNLQPVMEMKTIITGIKKLQTGDIVGYGNTFTARSDMVIATVPVGYYEGIERRLSNAGTVLVGHDRVPCPIVGRVSMNITTIDVSKLGNVTIGDQAIVISNNLADENSIPAMAKKYGEITYEIAVRIPAHLKRVVVP